MKGENRIVPDLAAVRFVDSSGIGALVSALKALGGKGDIVLCGVAAPVAQMFSLARLDRLFQTFPRREEALASSRT